MIGHEGAADFSAAGELDVMRIDDYEDDRTGRNAARGLDRRAGRNIDVPPFDEHDELVTRAAVESQRVSAGQGDAAGDFNHVHRAVAGDFGRAVDRRESLGRSHVFEIGEEVADRAFVVGKVLLNHAADVMRAGFVELVHVIDGAGVNVAVDGATAGDCRGRATEEHDIAADVGSRHMQRGSAETDETGALGETAVAGLKIQTGLTAIARRGPASGA